MWSEVIYGPSTGNMLVDWMASLRNIFEVRIY